MREILFRGKRIDNGEWVHGQYLKREYSGFTDNSIWTPKGTIPVKPETIGQFTGLTDKNGNKIFEGDKFAGDEPGEYYAISWNEEEATFQANLYGYNVSYGEGSQEIYDDEVTCIDTNCFELSALSSDVIIGNIHDHGLAIDINTI